VGTQDNNNCISYYRRHLSDTNRGGLIPAPLVAIALAGGAGSIALQVGLNVATGKKTTERDVVEAGLIGVIPGVGMAKGVGTVGYRFYKGRKIVQAYKPGVKMHSVSNVGTRLGVGQSITSNISKREAYQNMLIYSAVGGTPAARGMIAAGVISKSLDKIYGTKTSQPFTETQRIKSSRNVGKRGAKPKTVKPRKVTRYGMKVNMCPPGYRLNAKGNMCVKI
jgi:hypothetical protein